jgi:diguanylate cyclase (GGDEF)-like protein
MNERRRTSTSIKIIGGKHCADILPLTKEQKILYTVMVVEDDETNLNIYAFHLKEDGYNVVLAKSAEECLEKLKTMPAPDLIIMDLNLGKSDRDGIDLMEEITSPKGMYLRTKFIVVTGQNLESQEDAELVERKNELYIYQFETKPINHKFLLHKIENAITHAITGHEASIDALTELPNRKMFDGKLFTEISQWTRHFEKWIQDPNYSRGRILDLSTMILDIDNFKIVNDTHGHPAGDEILRAIGKFFSERYGGRQVRQLRQSDLVARYGGEEFGLVLPETKFYSARNIFARFNYNFLLKVTEINARIPCFVTISGGISTLSFDLFVETDKNRKRRFTDFFKEAGLAACFKNWRLNDDAHEIIYALLVNSADMALYKVKQLKELTNGLFRGETYIRNPLMEFDAAEILSHEV